MKAILEKTYKIIKIDFSINKLSVIIIYIVIGIIGKIAYPILMEYVYRPVLEGNFKELSIDLDWADSWTVNSELTVINTGKRETAIEIQSVLLLFPGFLETPYHIPIDTVIEIDKLTQKKIKICGTFPNDFDTITCRPKLLKAVIVFHDLSSSYITRVEKDTSEIRWQAMFGLVDKENKFSLSEDHTPSSNSFENDSISIDMFGTYELMYNMKKYTIRYYPNQYKLSHKIINDKIYLTPDIHLGYNDILAGKRVNIPSSYKLITSKEIAKKIVINEDYYIRLSSKKNKGDGIVEFTNYEFLTNDKKATIVYFFK